MKKYFKYILTLVMVFLYMGCKEDLEPRPATYSKLLTGENSKSWVLSKLFFVFDDDEFDPVDITDLLAPCEQDDLYTFYREGKVLEITEGSSKCDPDAPDLIARTSWDIVNASASLLYGSNVDYTLFELTSDKLVYGFKDTLTFPVFEEIPIYDEVVGFYQWNYIVESEK